MQLVFRHMQCYFDITYDGYCTIFKFETSLLRHNFDLQRAQSNSLEAGMATDVARSIVNEARLQHRSEMHQTARKSRAILRLKSLKIDPPEPSGYDGYYNDKDNPVPGHLESDVHVSDHGLGNSSNGNVVLEPAFEIANTQVIARFLSQKFLQERKKAQEKLVLDRQDYSVYDYEDDVEDPEQLVHVEFMLLQVG